ncbi:MAG: trigger factor [Clostridia bacterium]|nr:trigger factor [Clostridia bacterium]
MKYVVEKGEKSTVKITITLNAKEWDEAQVVAYNKTKHKYQIQGFRKGHVPKAVIEQFYGKGVFFEDAINEAFSKHYFDILDKETEIEPIDRPDVSIDKIDEKGLKLVAEVPVKPEVTIGAYKGIKIDKVEYNVSDDDIQTEINRLLEQNTTEINVDGRPAKDGDVTIIDYSGSIDGVKFAGGTAEKQSLTLGSGMFIPGFEDQVIGMNIGETKDINVKFPENYGAEDLKGKDAVFTVTLHEIKEKQTPALTDEFVKEKANFDTVDAYKASIKERLEKANAQRAEREVEDNLIKAITDASEVEIPNSLIEREIDNMVQQTSYRLMYQGLKFEDYLKYTGQTLEAYREGCKDSAKEHVKTQLVIDKIITDEKIEATAEDIDAKLLEQATSIGKSLEEYKKSVNDKQLSYVENNVIIDKLFKFLKENNEIAVAPKKAPAKKTTAKKTTKKVEEDSEEKKEPAKKTTAKKTTTKKATAKKAD